MIVVCHGMKATEVGLQGGRGHLVVWGAVARELAIDFGTASTRVYERGRGLIYDEPTVAAVDTKTREVLALGHEADDLVGRTTRHVVMVRPLRQGAITDFDMAERMLRAILARCGTTKVSRPRILLSVPAAATSIERRALKQAARSAGAHQSHLLEAPMAAAIGLGLPINDPVGSVVVDVGAGTSETGVVSLGGVVALKALRLGGQDLDRDIADLIRHQCDLVISEHAAEALKVAIGAAGSLEPPLHAEIHGRVVASGERASALVSSEEIGHAMADHLRAMVEGVAACLADSPPEFAQDALFEGIHLLGGGSKLVGLAEQLSAGTSVPVHTVEHPEHVVIEGAGRCLDDLGRFSALFASAER